MKLSLVQLKDNTAKLLLWMTLLATFYGGVLINWIDLFGTPHTPAATLWIILMYFWPFLLVLFFRGIQDWEITVAFGLYTSLLNDLLYAPVGRYLFGLAHNLQDFYLFQFGFKGLTFGWIAHFGFFDIPITSLTMGISIYARIAAIIYLLKRL